MSGVKEFIDEQNKPYLKNQAKEGEILDIGEIYFSLGTFSGKYELEFKNELLKTFDQKRLDALMVGGQTAMNDAIGFGLDDFEKHQKNKNNKRLFVIVTDGEENSSRSYSKNQVAKLVKKKQDEENVEFVFLGANINVQETSNSLQIQSHSQITFDQDKDH
eukprot:UN28801